RMTNGVRSRLPWLAHSSFGIRHYDLRWYPRLRALRSGNDSLRHMDFRLNGVGDEALFVREMMEPFFIRGRWEFPAAINHSRIKRYGADPRDATLVFRHHPHGLVFVTVDLKARFAREVKKGEHVATGY